MSELVWFLVPASALLWMAGGTWWKPWRRYLYPLVLGFGLHNIGLAVTVSVVAHLGYGDRASWLKRWLIGAAYGASVLWFGRSAWPWAILLMVSFTGLLWLTRRYNQVPHKMIEMLHGGQLAWVAVWLALR